MYRIMNITNNRSYYSHVAHDHTVMYDLNTQRHIQLLHGRMHFDCLNCLLRTLAHAQRLS